MKNIILVLFIAALLLSSCQPQLIRHSAHKAPQIRVLLKEIAQRDSVSFAGPFQLLAPEANYELGSNNTFLILSVLPDGFRLSNPKRIFTFREGDKVRLASQNNSGVFKLNNRVYRGEILIRRPAGGNIQLINRIDLEEYLKGVVPSEMPTTKEGYRESLKAQAICARTYALKKMMERKTEDYDVYSDVWDQVYKGRSAERPLSTEAILATRGDVLMFKDTLAAVFYHSTCGGISESVQNVWPSLHYSYMQAQKDVIGSEFACSVSPHYRWRRQFSLEQLDSLFEVSYQKSILKKSVADSTLLRFDAHVLERSVNGRVQKMQISYGDTTVDLNGFTIRRFFSNAPEGPLRSRLFSISANDSSLVINGGGYGHGVGLCQWGAMHMSEKGFKYYDILVNKYFKGTYLKKVY